MSNPCPRLGAAIVLVGWGLANFAGCGGTHGLLRPTDPVDVGVPEDQVSLRSRDVTVDVETLRGEPGDRIELPLFDGRSLTLVFERREDFKQGGLAWVGRPEKQAGTAVFGVKGEAVVGTIQMNDGTRYLLRPLRGGLHRLFQIDPTKIPDDCPTSGPGVHAHDDPSRDTCATDPPTDIDVLVVYSDDARVGAGSADAMEAAVYAAVAEANGTYLNSDVTQRLRLAHVEEVSYAESANSTTDKTRLQNKTDGFIDNVHTLRDAFAADVVILITETLQSSVFGEAFIMGTVANAFESSAFGVVKRINAVGNFTFAHELGHIMGARHDWAGDNTNNSPFTFNHGHSVSTPSDPLVPAWRTVMARNALGGTRLPFWSNPNLDFPIGGNVTDPMGTATGTQQTDNHRTLNSTALTVANFRCSSPGAPNVWMKDTWNDSGAEPDPLTAGEAMWKSPYIWVRHAQDASRVLQHQHENPEMGSVNFIYVKLHNGFSSNASGDLEIYAADASTSLTWPSGWTLVGSVQVTGFAAHSTQVIEQSWTPATTGHFCLLARWVSVADPMAVAEGADITTNIRNNNNLVWRNVNVVDLSSDSSADVAMIVRSVKHIQGVTQLRFAGSFLPHGRVLVQLDERLAEVWKLGGGKASGIKRDGKSLILNARGATLDNLDLPPGFEGRLTIKFEKVRNSPRREFELDVSQVTEGRVLGGVSYLIRTTVPTK